MSYFFEQKVFGIQYLNAKISNIVVEGYFVKEIFQEKERIIVLKKNKNDEIRKTLLLAVPAFVPVSFTILIKVSGVVASSSAVVRLLIISNFFFGLYRLNTSWLIFTAIVLKN